MSDLRQALRSIRGDLDEARKILHYGGGYPVTALAKEDLTSLTLSYDRSMVTLGDSQVYRAQGADMIGTDSPAARMDGTRQMIRSHIALLDKWKKKTKQSGEFEQTFDLGTVIERMFDDVRSEIKLIDATLKFEKAAAPARRRRP